MEPLANLDLWIQHAGSRWTDAEKEKIVVCILVLSTFDLDGIVIVLDEDRKKAIHINQSVFSSLLGAFAVSAEVMIVVLATASDVAKLGGPSSLLHIVGMIGARPIASLFLVIIMFMPPAWLFLRGCFWRVDVSDEVLTYNTLFRSRSVRTTEIKRVKGRRGRGGNVYKLYLRDGTSIAMHDIEGASLVGLARL